MASALARIAADARRSAGPGERDQPKQTTNEHITLIEFVWSGRMGVQPVIFIERRWLQ